MDKVLLNDWLKHPVTEIFKALILEHKNATKEILANCELEISNIGKVNKLKGQYFTLEFIEDLETFLTEKLTKEVITDDQET